MADFSAHSLRKLTRAAWTLAGGRALPGRCPVCTRKTLFVPLGAWWREDLKCIRCRSSARQRALMAWLPGQMPRLEALDVYEPAPHGALSRQLADRARSFTGSHYAGDPASSAPATGLPNEDLHRLSFDDQSFDLVITQDVMEHVADPPRAFAEIARVLRPGGSHVFTIPWFPDRPTRQRARLHAGRPEHLVEPEYHGNPVSGEGSLVFTDFGADLPERIRQWSGMTTRVHSMADRSAGICGDSLNVFHSVKRVRKRVDPAA